MEKYQAFYLFGIAVGWLAHRYGNVSGPTLAVGLLVCVGIYLVMP